MNRCQSLSQAPQIMNTGFELKDPPFCTGGHPLRYRAQSSLSNRITSPSLISLCTKPQI